MKIVSYLLWIVVIVLGVSFAGLNAALVRFNYYVGDVELPLSFLLSLAFAVGGFLGVIASLNLIVQAKSQERRAKRALKKSEKTLSSNDSSH